MQNQNYYNSVVCGTQTIWYVEVQVYLMESSS